MENTGKNSMVVSSTQVCYGEDVLMMRVDNCLIFGNKDALQKLAKKLEGRTAKVERTSVKNTYICSNCGRPMHPVDFSIPNKYCGFCGAKLDWSGIDE